jgi:adenylate kinase
MIKANKKILIFFGPPGSGKGTQAGMLGKKLKLPIISTGDLFRAEIKRKTAIGKKVKKILADGKLVSDIIVYKILDRRLLKNDVTKGFILDGFPRNKKQLDYVVRKIKKLTLKEDIIYSIFVDVSDKEVQSRISGRRICACGASYHIRYNPPRVKDYCDRCGAKIQIRKDDKPDVVRKRLKLYHKEIKPVLIYWEKEKELVRINGERSIGKIHSGIVKKLKEVKII